VGRRPDEVDVASNQLRESLVGTVVGLAAEQFMIGIGVHRFFGMEHPPNGESDTVSIWQLASGNWELPPRLR